MKHLVTIVIDTKVYESAMKLVDVTKGVGFSEVVERALKIYIAEIEVADSENIEV